MIRTSCMLLAASVSLLAATAPRAHAGEVCNETSFVVDVAKAWRAPEGLTVAGWTRILPGQCADIGPDEAADQYLYARSTPAYLGGVREWRGALDACIDEADFEIRGVGDCQALGLETRPFRRLNEAELGRAVLMELEDFGDRAEEAGIQRLLQAAGYDIRTIDGYAGRRTRRQIAAFQNDIDQNFGADRVGLMQALHARALERNGGAGLQVCNEAAAPIAAAVARATGEGYEARGWWRIAPGACAQPLAMRLTEGEVFVHARLMEPSGARAITAGSELFCVGDGRFTTMDREGCTETGFEAAGFRPAPAPENGGARMMLGDDDFDEAAR